MRAIAQLTKVVKDYQDPDDTVTSEDLLGSDFDDKVHVRFFKPKRARKNSDNPALASQRRSLKRAWLVGKFPRQTAVPTVRTMLRPRVVSRIECNSKEHTFEVGSHADTTCLGSGTIQIYNFDCPVNVHWYDSAMGVKQFQTISGVVGYIHPFTGRKYHVVVHQAIHMPNMDHHLLVKSEGVDGCKVWCLV